MQFAYFALYLEDKNLKNLDEKDRKELEAKMANAFEENIVKLPTELREI